MTIERSHPRINGEPSDGPSSQPSRPGHLGELRRRSEQHSQAARDAIARVIGAGQAEKQLAQLRNEGGQ
jgi:hypothetical protein